MRMARNNRRGYANGNEVSHTSTNGVDTDSVDDLRDRLVDLQATVEKLVERARVDPLPVDPEIDQAARTLKFAEQTADAVVAEARAEAAEIVEDAERQRAEIIRRAHEQAELDYGAQRDHVLAASSAWQDQRAEVLAQLDGLAVVISTYQMGVAAIDRTVTSVAGALRHDVAEMPLPLEAGSQARAGDDADEGGGADGEQSDPERVAVPKGWRPEVGFWS